MESSVVCSWSRYKYAPQSVITKHVQDGIIRQCDEEELLDNKRLI